MDLFKSFATDSTLESNGTWVPFGDVKFLVARMGNPHYAKKLNKLYEAHRHALDMEDEAANTLNEKLMVEVMADTILLGWEGKVEFDGKVLPYSRENAVKALALKDFRAEIARMAADMDAYRLGKEAEAGKP